MDLNYYTGIINLASSIMALVAAIVTLIATQKKCLSFLCLAEQ
jgi:hypothetical protein